MPKNPTDSLLKGVKQWLTQRDVALNATPGVGVATNCTPEQSNQLFTELATESGIHLVLSGEQRQQLLSLLLLDAQEPLIIALL